MPFEPPLPRERWDQIPPAAQAALLLAFQLYQRRLDALAAEVRALQERLGRHATHSSKAPSAETDPVPRIPGRINQTVLSVTF